MDARTEIGRPTALTHKETRLIVWGVLLPLFMGSIDNTILASALPTIGHDLGNMTGLPWLITIYLLAATAAMPLYGKIADIRGRRFALHIAIAAYMAGSLVCALAPSMMILILRPRPAGARRFRASHRSPSSCSATPPRRRSAGPTTRISR